VTTQELYLSKVLLYKAANVSVFQEVQNKIYLKNMKFI